MDRAMIKILIVKQMPNICRWIMKYDCEQRRINQDYELTELKERQKVQLRQKAAKKGLDPEAFTGKYPPRIRMFSKYERRTDTRTYAGRESTREAGRWSGQKCWKRSTRRNWTNGTREPNLDFLSGSESALVKRPELQILQRARKTRLRVQLPRKCTRRRRRRMKTMMRRKSNANNIDHSNVSTTKNKNHVRLCFLYLK